MKLKTLMIMSLTLLSNRFQLLSSSKDSDNQSPIFSKPIENVTIPVGRNLQMACVVKFLGNYKVAWIRVKDKSILTIHKHVITRNYRFNLIINDNCTFILMIKNIQESDRGGYMCQINTFPMKSQVGYVDVVVPPKLISDNISSMQVVKEGGNVTLECKTFGYPTPVVKWRREDNRKIIAVDTQKDKYNSQSVVGEQLVLNHVTRNQSGVYLCIASNGVPPAISRRLILQVNFAPIVSVPKHIIQVEINQDLSIDCHIKAFPHPKRVWIRKSIELIKSNGKYNIELKESLFSSNFRLTIKSIQKQDLGSYLCFASNNLGAQQALVIIKEFDLNEDISSENEISKDESSESNQTVYANNNKSSLKKKQARIRTAKKSNQIKYIKDSGNKCPSSYLLQSVSFIFSFWLFYNLSS